MIKLVGFNPLRRSRMLADGRSRAASIEVDEDLPAETDVVVVGAGLAGIACALHLNQAGLRVVVCEKGKVAGEQSSRAMGWVASLGDAPDQLALSSESKRLWNSYRALLGVDTTYRRTGLTILCYSDEEVASLEAWAAQALERGQGDAHLILGQSLVGRLPGRERTGAIAAMHQASDGSVEPELATTRLAAAARRCGVVILEGCAVRGVETSRGAVSHVVTEQGVVRATALVVAGGAWSRLFLGNLGIGIPQLPVYSSVLRTNGIQTNLAGCGAAKAFGWRRQADGSCSLGNNSAIASVVPDSFRWMRHFLPALKGAHGGLSIDLDRDFFHHLFGRSRWRLDEASPFERQRILTSIPDPKTTAGVLAEIGKAFPDFHGARVVESWGAVIDVTPDRTPIVSPLEKVGGLYACTGFSAHGLAMAPAAGKLIADLISGGRPDVDSRPYSLTRFERPASGRTLA